MAKQRGKKTPRPIVEFTCARCARKVKEKESWRNRYNSEVSLPHADGERKKMRVCRQCITIINRESEMAYRPLGQDLMVRDFVKRPSAQLAKRFIEHQLVPYDFSKATLYVGLREIENSLGAVIAKSLIPKRPKGKGSRLNWKPWYEVNVQVRRTTLYPHTDSRNVATVQVTDVAARAFMKVKWFYETTEVTFHDETEALVFGAGYGLFKVLRKHVPKEVPGRASKVGMTAYGVQWLQEFRKWRTALGQENANVVS